MASANAIRSALVAKIISLAFRRSMRSHGVKIESQLIINIFWFDFFAVSKLL